MKKKVKQVFNPKIDAWVKVQTVGKKSRILDVKEKNPQVPFKGLRMK